MNIMNKFLSVFGGSKKEPIAQEPAKSNKEKPLFSEGERDKFIETIAVNQLNALIDASDQPSDFFFMVTNRNLYLSISNEVVNHIMNFRGIVGVQPMSNPCNLAYRLVISPLKASNDLGATWGNGVSMPAEIISVPVKADTYRLKTTISPTLMEDSNRTDDVNDIVNKIAHEIALEIYNKIITDLFKIAASSIKIIRRRMDDTEYLHSKHALFAINHATNEIARATRRGPGNFIVCSPSSLPALQRYFLITNISNNTTCVNVPFDDYNSSHAMNIVGVNGRVMYRVYVSDAANAELRHRFLIGYNGMGVTDSGYIHCHYIPVMSYGRNNADVEMIENVSRYGTVIDLNDDNYYGCSKNYYRIVDVEPY